MPPLSESPRTIIGTASGSPAAPLRRLCAQPSSHGDEPVGRVVLLVGEQQIVSMVAVEVDETQATVAALRVGHQDVVRQRERQPGSSEPRPARSSGSGHAPRCSGWLAMSSQIPSRSRSAEPNASVHAVPRREHRRRLDLESCQTLRILHPLHAVVMPQRAGSFIAEEQRGRPIGTQHPEASSCLSHSKVRVSLDQRDRKVALHPGAERRRPASGAAHLLVRDHHVREAVSVHVDQAHSLILAILSAQRKSVEQHRLEPLHGLTQGEELHLRSVCRGRVVDDLDHLLVADPTGGMEAEGEDALAGQPSRRCPRRGR